MGKYIVKRLLLLIPTMLLVCIIVFTLIRIMPGSAVDALTQRLIKTGSVNVDTQQVEAMLGLDQPAVTQFFTWLSGVAHGDLGRCYFQNKTVVEAISLYLPATIELGVLTLILSNLISIPLGLICAARQDSAADYLVRTISMVLMSIPVFWIAIMCIIYPAIWWGYTPPSTFVSILQDPIENLRMFLLPALLGAFGQAGMQIRMTRTMTLEVMRADYIRTAWAKGAGEGRALFFHAFRNALIPIITIIGGSVSTILGGSVIMESIFNIPGLGNQALTALNDRDYPLVQGIVLVTALFIMITNMLVDICYKWADPRVSLDKEGG